MPLIQEQKLTQQQIQQQRLSPLLKMATHLIEMPLMQFEEKVQTEIDTNPSLEEAGDGTEISAEYAETSDYGTNDIISGDDDIDATATMEREDRADALTQALENFGADDRMDTEYSDDFKPASQALPNDSLRSFEGSDTTSFIDTLMDQMRMEDLDDTQQTIMEYLIGSLDDDGLLRKSLTTISDELAIYHYIIVSEAEIETVLHKLQEFDPAGVGARSLQECLLLQVARRDDSPEKTLMERLLTKCYDDFINNRLAAVQQRMQLSDYQMEELKHEIRRLNPKPGAALSEVEGHSTEQIIPDFIVHVDYDGNISFELNNGRVPTLHVVSEDEMFLDKWQKHLDEGHKLSKGEREAMEFTRRNVDSAKLFLSAIQLRNRSMVLTMKAIIDLQRRYFIDGDELEMCPMKLQDIADRTGLDVSTVSRVCQSKFVQTPWGIFSLRHFFSTQYTTEDGNTLSTKQIKEALKDVIAEEDPRHPLSDIAICTAMASKGFPVARRTITKYREQMGIPVARLRRNSLRKV